MQTKAETSPGIRAGDRARLPGETMAHPAAPWTRGIVCPEHASDQLVRLAQFVECIFALVGCPRIPPGFARTEAGLGSFANRVQASLYGFRRPRIPKRRADILAPRRAMTGHVPENFFERQLPWFHLQTHAPLHGVSKRRREVLPRVPVALAETSTIDEGASGTDAQELAAELLRVSSAHAHSNVRTVARGHGRSRRGALRHRRLVQPRTTPGHGQSRGDRSLPAHAGRARSRPRSVYVALPVVALYSSRRLGEHHAIGPCGTTPDSC